MLRVGTVVYHSEWEAVGKIIDVRSTDAELAHHVLVDFGHEIGRRWAERSLLTRATDSSWPKARKRTVRALWYVVLSDRRWATAHEQAWCVSLVEHALLQMPNVEWAQVRSPSGESTYLSRNEDSRLWREKISMIGGNLDSAPPAPPPAPPQARRPERTWPGRAVAPARAFPEVLPASDDRWRDVYDLTADSENDVPPPLYPKTTFQRERLRKITERARSAAMDREQVANEEEEEEGL